MKKSHGSDVDSNDVNAVLENLLRLEIFYKEFNYEEIEETEGYPVRCSADLLPLALLSM